MKLLSTLRLQWQILRTCHASNLQKIILSTTELTRNHLTPEISLRLVTPQCKLWYSNGNDLPYPDPYWAFFWPGGQSLTRYVLH